MYHIEITLCIPKTYANKYTWCFSNHAEAIMDFTNTKSRRRPLKYGRNLITKNGKILGFTSEGLDKTGRKKDMCRQIYKRKACKILIIIIIIIIIIIRRRRRRRRRRKAIVSIFQATNKWNLPRGHLGIAKKGNPLERNRISSINSTKERHNEKLR